MMATGAKAEVVEVGIFGAGQFIPTDELSAGMVGYITASLKNVQDTRVGDTVTLASDPCKEALPGYKKGSANGLLRTLPIRWSEIPGSSGCSRETSA